MRLLIALGGNAIKQANEDGSTEEQFTNCEKTARVIAQIVKRMGKNDRLLITHGNGPQVGNIMIQQDTAKEIIPAQRMDVVGAMTQGQIGYMIEQSLLNAFTESRINARVCAIVTQTIVNRNDPEFFDENASKPVGNYMREEEAKKLKEERPEYIIKKVKPDEKGWRRVVPSPEPIQQVEGDIIKTLVDLGVIVIASGGGGIPVIKTRKGYRGVEAVIDKDLGAERLAEITEMDVLLILTDVERVKLNYGKEDEKDVERMSVDEAEHYLKEGQFLKGSMEPKVKACIRFLRKGGERAVIAALDKAKDALEGKSGTEIFP
ncbi:MAG: carbamate kinase [Candidatus Thermoplasmatota archaeon]|nr:carbamate kinase [Candidatus Thermoplasmatota archaeon]